MNDSPIGVKECRPRRSFTNNTCQVFVEFGSALRLGDEVGMKLVALQEARVMSFRASLLLVQEADRHQKQRPPMVLGIPKEGDPLYTVVLGYIVLLAELVALARLNLLICRTIERYSFSVPGGGSNRSLSYRASAPGLRSPNQSRWLGRLQS